MSLRRFLLKSIYPAYRVLMSFTSKGTVLSNRAMTSPPETFYSLSVLLNNGMPLPFEALRGKKVLLVNTASDCVYTSQYAELEQLEKETAGQLSIIGFPSNDFNEQEKGTDKEIASFCDRRYHISFPLVTKSHVVGAQRHPVYEWLTDTRKNGWNSQTPQWNFSKYLVDENGMLTHYFGPAVTPAEIRKRAFSKM